MSGLGEDAILNGSDALTARDIEAADRFRSGDAAIDGLEELVDDEVARTIALNAPVSRDLRILLSVLKLAGSLERIGDYAKNIAKRVTVLSETRVERRCVLFSLSVAASAFPGRSNTNAPQGEWGSHPRSVRRVPAECYTQKELPPIWHRAP